MKSGPSKYRRNELATVALVMITVAVGIAAGRIAVVKSRDGDTAFLSANDRSRWCTVASLVEDGTFAIDRQIAITDASGKRRPWSTIDRVRHTGTDGVMHDYSSKPPLFSILVAGVYWPVYQISGMSLTEQPIYVTRIVLAIVNLPILLIMLVAVWRMLEGSYAPDSAKMFGLAIACFGTALLPMTVSLGNHLPAAMTTAVTLMIYLSVAGENQFKKIATPYFVAGLAAAATVVNELPSLAMLVVWIVLFYRQHRIATASIFLPAVAFVGIAFLSTNMIAHQSIRPPYMHRSDGEVLGSITTGSRDARPTEGDVAKWFQTNVNRNVASLVNPQLVSTSSPDRWIIQSSDGNLRYALVRSTIAKSPGSWMIRQWDHWYDYPRSYWMGERPGVDAGEKNRFVYAFHLLVGHYGIFTLTPVWLLVPYGLSMRIREPQGRYRFYLATSIAAVSLICFTFYISRPEIDRNFGGVSSSFRWMLWFTPLWIWAALPAITWAMERDWGRKVLFVLLAASIFSMATALDNPWQHPWIYRYLAFLGWL